MFIENKRFIHSILRINAAFYIYQLEHNCNNVINNVVRIIKLATAANNNYSVFVTKVQCYFYFNDITLLLYLLQLQLLQLLLLIIISIIIIVITIKNKELLLFTPLEFFISGLAGGFP